MEKFGTRNNCLTIKFINVTINLDTLVLLKKFRAEFALEKRRDIYAKQVIPELSL